MIRIVAMLLVVALHCMDYGGFIKLSEANLFLSLFVSLNHTISICAVNCFALISGYLLMVKSVGINWQACGWKFAFIPLSLQRCSVLYSPKKLHYYLCAKASFRYQQTNIGISRLMWGYSF